MKVELPKKRGPKPFLPTNYPEAKIRYNLSVSLDLLRIKSGLTRWKFANKVGISDSHFTKLMNEEIGMSIPKLIEISEAYGVTIYWLLGMNELGEWIKDGPWGKKGPWSKPQ